MAELFDRFEINRVPRWPLLTRLLALSVVLHGLFLVAVVYVPTVRGMLYVAGKMSGLKFVSEDYDPTLIGQRATIMRLPPHERLYYPPDYFGAPEVAETSPYQPALVQQAAAPPPSRNREGEPIPDAGHLADPDPGGEGDRGATRQHREGQRHQAPARAQHQALRGHRAQGQGDD